MNPNILGIALGSLAMVLSIADAVMTGRFLDRLATAQGAEVAHPAHQVSAAQPDDSDLQALRGQLQKLHNELLGLQVGPVTSMEQLTKVVDNHLAYRRRSESVHKFVTRRNDIRALSRDWGQVVCQAFKFEGADRTRVTDIFKKLEDDWKKLASTTGGEPGLEESIETLLKNADNEILSIIPESERKRYRPIPRGWSSGLVGDPNFGK
jgi:hypothetical protein